MDKHSEETGVHTTTNSLPATTSLTIIHSTGVFTHNILWCYCPGSPKQYLQLLKAGLFPPSISHPRTAFTFNVLDNFLIDALECKTSVSSFFQKLCCLTNNAFPDSVPDQYHELMRVWLIMRRYVVDGNFTAQHMNMRQPHFDVSLSDGLGYMVTEAEYQAHLSSAVESKDKSSCSNHHAVNAANINRSNLQATGVGATACARHGCFVPHAVVDFQKGEQ
ncbi:hypothetical protein BD769DRAFT_1627106 [Suillus cothurnatus]|nr:hypothetical protein BD769DRAFT_1627106 [Suillus cothurnatus]